MLFVERCLIFSSFPLDGSGLDLTLMTSSGTYPSHILQQSLSGFTDNISETACVTTSIQKPTYKIDPPLLISDVVMTLLWSRDLHF